MSDPLFHFKSYFSHWFRATNAHGIHSPFVFELYNQTIRNKNLELAEVLYKVRASFSRDRTSINLIDQQSGRTTSKSIRSIAKRSTSSIKFQVFLTQLVDQLGVKTVLETGTSLGLTTVALALSDAERIVSIEVSESLYETARRLVARLPVAEKIHLIQGSIASTLESAIIDVKPELIFLDADHRPEATRFCIDTVMTHSTGVRCIVIHDIYWSREMNQLWNTLVTDDRFSISIDIFEAGILFPKYPSEKQHFTLRF